MRIIIVGGGIAGLSTYLHLRKHLSTAHTITIYESHEPRSKLPTTSSSTPSTINLESLSESTAIVGGGLGISPNGMRVLLDLSKDLHDAVAAQGFPVEDFVFKGANGWTLGVSKTSDNTVKGGEGEVCVASSRHGLWEAVMRFVVREGGEEAVKYRKIVGIERNEEGGKTAVRWVDKDGNEEREEADLLIGADGVKSVVRSFLFGDDEKFKPTYTGLSGVGGFLRTPIPPSTLNPPAMVFTFGRNGFFGYSSGSPPSAQSLMWWSTYEAPITKTIDPSAIKASLLQRHKDWKDPVVQDIIQKAEVESVYPTWVLDELPHWGKRGVVLLGDAAHAMDPTTGQGASQALEDAQTLSLLLKELLEPEVESETPHSSSDASLSEREKVDLAIKLVYEIRSPRVHEIVERGKKISGRKANVGVIAEYFMYFFLWLLNAFPSIARAMLGDVNRRLYAWSAEEEVQKATQKYRAEAEGEATN